MICDSRKKTNPLVSVLISTYNRPEYVGCAIESVLGQRYRDIELIVVRDGGRSVDYVIKRFDDPRLKFIDRPRNRGLPYSFNEALSEAKGKYICYLGDDDLFYPHHVEVLVDALEGQDQVGVAYSDLYKVHCRLTPDGRRIALSKNIEISRDFDRMLMMQFNHTLHVSLIHRRDLVEKTGPYNENLNVMIDWDLARRLAFFTDFKHVYDVTGEFYAPVGDCDRISVQKRRNADEYILNLLTIRSARPAKPWPKIGDLSIILLADCSDANLEQSLRGIYSHTFYPYQIYLPLPYQLLAGLKTIVPNIIGVPVEATAGPQRKINEALAVCEGDYVVVVPAGYRIEYDNVAWVEKSLEPLIKSTDPLEAFELEDSSESCWMAVFRTARLREIRQRFGNLPLRQSVEAAGVKTRRARQEEYPFQFDSMLTTAYALEGEGDWLRAAKVYEYLAENYQNDLWMKKLCANALYRSGRWTKAAALAAQVNSSRPTVSSLLVEARCRQKLNDLAGAIELYGKAEGMLEGKYFPVMAGHEPVV